VEPLKLVIFQLTHFTDIVRCVAFCNIYIIMKALNGFLMTQRQMTLKDVCGYINFISHVSNIHYQPRMLDTFLVDTVDMIRL